MSTLTVGSRVRLLRFLLSIFVRFRLSVGRIALAFRARLTLLWRSILTFTSASRNQSWTPLRANNVPSASDENPTEQHLRMSDGADVNDGTLAVPPIQPIIPWEDRLSKYPVSTPSKDFTFCPASPAGGSQRYTPEAVGDSKPLTIQAGQLELLFAQPSLPDGWSRLVHPEGNVLFYHSELRVFTESDVPRHRADLLFCAIKLIQMAIETRGVIMDELTEFVVNIDDSEGICDYYFVDHTHRLLFWVHPIEPLDVLSTDLQVISGYSHIRYLVEAQYWYYIVDGEESRLHCQFYPHNRTLPHAVFKDLRGMLNFAKTDVMTAHSSTSPFAQDELVAILDIVNSLKDDKEISDPYSIWIIGRLMVLFTEVQFLNFCGQPCARLNADTPLFGKQTWNRSWIFRTVNIFLFGSPNEHAVRLQRVWVDGIIIQPRWRDFVSSLTDEFTRYTIFSTVMLAVNFGFLAPGLVNAGSATSPIQIMIYSSVVATIGSIVFSLALLKIYSNPELTIASRAAEALRTLTESEWGMARLSIAHGLPISCLIWSITLFSGALGTQIFTRQELGTYVALGVECLILVLFASMSRGVVRLFSNDDDGDDGDSARAWLWRDVELAMKLLTFRRD